MTFSRPLAAEVLQRNGFEGNPGRQVVTLRDTSFAPG